MTIPSNQSITYELVQISPAHAKGWLQTKRSEKRANRLQIRTYADDMRARRWMPNGDPIIFGNSGALLSGVLRLRACIEADASFPSLVIRGVADSHFETIDSVRRRTVADILTIRKEQNGRILAAALAVLWRYVNDDYVSPTRTSPSAQALLQILENNPSIRDSMKLTQDASRLMSPAIAGALHYLFTCADAENAHTFFDQLLDEEISTGPIFLLRQQLKQLREARGAKSQGLLLALCIKAWEAFISGAEMKQLRFVPGNDNTPRVSNLQEASFRSGVAEESAIRRAAVAVDVGAETLPHMEVEIREVTPKAAKEMLEHNDSNRGVAALVVDKYARDMKRGAWALNGQTIKFGKSGRLLDGQHRLQAAILSECSFPAIIVRGLDDAVFDTFDLGSRRAIGDVLGDRGEINTSSLGAALRQLWLLRHGLIQSRGAAPTIAELLDLLEQNPELRESARLQHKIREITAPTLILALHYLFTRVDKDQASWFLNRLSDGAELTPRHPILTLRDQLMRARSQRKVTVSDAERAAWTIKAWNAYRQNRAVAALKWQQLGPRKEPFPEISGLTELRRALAA